MNNPIYILSGLGADKSVFKKLDFRGHEVNFIEWIFPIENETIENYARRLLDQIPVSKPILIGLSFGGIIAMEIAKQIETEKVILLSSAKTKNEIPFYYRLAGMLNLHQVIPTRFLKKSNFLTNWFFGIKIDFEKILLKSILEETDATFLTWAIDKIVKWKNESIPKNIFHIHGTADRILPIRYIKTDVKIANGGHLMTLDKAEDISRILGMYLSSD
ncbi:MAG: alpha/beta fold hydrolase [Leadbetterella sp.]